MNRNTELLMGIRYVVKYLDRINREIGKEFGLSQTEVNIISFLHNNPGKDTASDITELRMMQKGNVSQAVELLIQKGYLERKQDCKDRRRIHLSLTRKSESITKETDKGRKELEEQIFAGFTSQERLLYLELCSRIFKNAIEGMEGKRE